MGVKVNRAVNLVNFHQVTTNGNANRHNRSPPAIPCRNNPSFLLLQFLVPSGLSDQTDSGVDDDTSCGVAFRFFVGGNSVKEHSQCHKKQRDVRKDALLGRSIESWVFWHFRLSFPAGRYVFRRLAVECWSSLVIY